MQQPKPVPAVGTIIKCCRKDIQFLGSNVPVLRIVLESDKWVASPDPKRGMHVYITEPVHIVLNKLTEVRITLANPQVAHAEALSASLTR
jgi:hypothetical protein